MIVLEAIEQRGRRVNLRAVAIFLCRWPNGDRSVVLARNRADAVEKLDEVGNAEGCPMRALSETQVHFVLADDGELVLDGLGGDTEAAIFAFCYPALNAARGSGQDVRSEVQRERVRGEDGPTEEPATELGRQAKAQLDMPTRIVNRVVSKAAKRRLRAFDSKGKPS